MDQSTIVKPHLDKARRDIEDAAAALGATWSADDNAAIGRLTNAGEALMRAISSVSLAVERLAELIVD